MQQVLLNGEWQLNGGPFKDVSATVPGCVHSDLLAAGLIPDPYYRDNEKELMWIGKTDWEYSRRFVISEEFLNEKKIVLQCAGLDTFAHITINGAEVANTNNMFRSWEFDIKGFLVPGENEIRIKFDSTYPYMEKRNRERWLWITGLGHHRVEGNNWVRKMQCNYGWDWGPICVTCGIWRDIQIMACSSARIDDVLIRQEHCPERVELKVDIKLERVSDSPVKVVVDLLHDEKFVARMEYETIADSLSASCVIQNPKLWWPNNLGEQNLYDIKVSILENGDIQDLWQKKIGLRTLRLERKPDAWGESFHFVINGVPFFAKGANWISADTFVTRASEEFYGQLIKDAAAANMNFLRVWGGGIYEQDIFYEWCDRYGICVWQDFMFACSAYPAFDPDFMESVKQEALDNVRRLRHHACMALWCGNNELEQISRCINQDGSNGAMSWDEYKSLFDVLLPDVVREYAPGMDYWPSSPHTPGEDRENWASPRAGDAHLWEVWHGRKPFEWYRTCEHRFNSEFGFQSFPEPRVVESYTLPEDRNVSSYIMEHHQRSGIGNDAIIQYMLSWFRLPSDFNMLLWLSQILQGMAMKYAVEHWRRSMPRGMGTLYWQLNDCWPAPSWASIDHVGNWKALQYMARKFYNPILISCVEDIPNGTAEIHLTNDTLEEIEGNVCWKFITTEGKVAEEGSMPTGAGANSTGMVQKLDLKEAIVAYGERNLMLHVFFTMNGRVVSDNLSYFCRPKHMELKRPVFRTETICVNERCYQVQLSADRPALWVWPDLEGFCARYSDRFFHILPGDRMEVNIDLPRSMSQDEMEQRLRWFSLVDTY